MRCAAQPLAKFWWFSPISFSTACLTVGFRSFRNSVHHCYSTKRVKLVNIPQLVHFWTCFHTCLPGVFQVLWPLIYAILWENKVSPFIYLFTTGFNFTSVIISEFLHLFSPSLSAIIGLIVPVQLHASTWMGTGCPQTTPNFTHTLTPFPAKLMPLDLVVLVSCSGLLFFIFVNSFSRSSFSHWKLRSALILCLLWNGSELAQLSRAYLCWTSAASLPMHALCFPHTTNHHCLAKHDTCFQFASPYL